MCLKETEGLSSCVVSDNYAAVDGIYKESLRSMKRPDQNESLF